MYSVLKIQIKNGDFKMKLTDENGFTLVEFIVVSCMMRCLTSGID